MEPSPAREVFSTWLALEAAKNMAKRYEQSAFFGAVLLQFHS